MAFTPLAGLRVLDLSLLGPGALAAHLADLGADVVKVEPPNGDYVREMSWPIVEGISLLHWQVNRGKRSIVLDLKNPAGVATLLELAAKADAVVEAMRPGSLDRLGVGYAALQAANPQLVMLTISGFGMTGPYQSIPSHGIAYDAWAGVVEAGTDSDGYRSIPAHPSIGIHAGPLYGAMGLLAGVIEARSTGRGSHIEVAQSDAAAAMDWLRSSTWRAYERSANEVTGNPADDYERRPPGTAGMEGGVRFQMYDTTDGVVLFMASERKFWKNFADATNRPDLFDRYPGAQYADHARGNTALRDELRDLFSTRSSVDWVTLGIEHNIPISPVNTPQTIAADPQFAQRLPWQRPGGRGADLVPSPIKVVGDELAAISPAPAVGEHTKGVLLDLLGYGDADIERLRAAGAFG